jgi:PBP1b-binding outer membrane lipoprotein LpoB
MMKSKFGFMILALAIVGVVFVSGCIQPKAAQEYNPMVNVSMRAARAEDGTVYLGAAATIFNGEAFPVYVYQLKLIDLNT